MDPTKFPEVIALNKLRAEADKSAERATAWLTRLDQARAALVTAQQFLMFRLDDVASRQLNEARAEVTSLEATVKVIQAAGGPDELRRVALADPLIFIELHAGFDRRLADLVKRRSEAAAILAQLRFEATIRAAEAGQDTSIVNSEPQAAEAYFRLTVIQHDIQASLVARNYAAAKGINHTPQSFESLLGQLKSPLPELPV